ncbi:MAG: phosphoribosylamine--glycine ligase [Saprospiraceae bacterium]|nr:phosphoribosylamine--glycine ligase [Saprospiraceae bacterium]MBL0099872.1 phosphoribosylamine--glycine ligase [Saprospiraceae bacterium]
MNILIIGNGGREHTLAWKISQSPKCTQLFIAPGNAGTALCGKNVPIEVTDISGIRQFCVDNKVELVVVGPEGPLVDGVTDAFRNEDTRHIGIIGPSAYAANLEGSKAFAKKFMQKYKIPTAAYLEVTRDNLQEGISFLKSLSPPYVLKADGLAAGKGVLILDDLGDACRQLLEMVDGKFGQASYKVVIEEFLDGIEFSVFALTDGVQYIMLPEAKDYKRAGVGDTGLNTGGMGAISPVPFVDKALWQKVMQRIVEPTINGIRNEGMDYVGFVFFGLIRVGDNPYVIEYNCRLGDPETEVIIPRINNDIVDVLMAAVSGQLSSIQMDINEDAAATVMIVSGGYPEEYSKHKVILHSDEIKTSLVFHAGTTELGGKIVTNGGRVIAVTTLDPDFRKAVKVSLSNAQVIEFDGKYYRSDIGFDL